MKNEFFEQKFFNNFDAPMQKLMELNVKMMQNLSLMKPMDLSSIKRPEDYFEKNMELFMQNSHMTLNYMRDMFNILESHWLNVSRNLEQNTKKMMSEVSTTIQKGTKEASTAAKSAAKKVSSSAIKKAASPAKKAAPTAKKSSLPVKKVSAKKNTKVTTSKTTSTLKSKQVAKSTHPKSTVVDVKGPMAQNASKDNIIADKSMPKISNLAEKSSPNIQNMGKSNPITNQ
ncbi:hypothetical protein OQJ19_15730 [Fluoribacter gormanii]|uniref:Phasin protein n=1 Tax=Fluoribacter gormanii TaxID=464 RepID=A0A377GJT9_9GAMM|nr:hypothetical protein [Fluoribacter gormanii]KTD05162.1 hypothetical protein Lgor_0581 [Fluoribacter gormanii]MCW8443655.1 hypothetical protein [Fluoribacter gormanii]MCW8472083.1 hypothetical protein [Fluoribacter gormanii]SIR88643.1 hypothetical protein SAMN05421777_1364 [Fluoribacter gormanii]STO24795.1 Uncharacterised protein [Fluoribacter gormanii]